MRAKRKTISIEAAEHAGAHRLRLSFSDGTTQLVDFGPFLREAQHPEIRKFLSPRRFARFTLENGELMWGDFDLIFPVVDLYENKLAPVVSDTRTRPRRSGEPVIR